MWTDKEEDYLRKIHHQCNVYHLYYNKKSLRYTALNQRFNIPILVISAINSLVAISMPEFLDQNYVSIMNGILSLATGILGSIQLFLKINEKLATCITVSLMFQKIGLKIGKELSIERDLRVPDGKDFLMECFTEFNNAIDKCYPIDRKIPNHLLLSFKEQQLTTQQSNITTTISSLISENNSLEQNSNDVDYIEAEKEIKNEEELDRILNAL